jgi:hypothetical protein
MVNNNLLLDSYAKRLHGQYIFTTWSRLSRDAVNNQAIRCLGGSMLFMFVSGVMRFLMNGTS